MKEMEAKEVVVGVSPSALKNQLDGFKWTLTEVPLKQKRGITQENVIVMTDDYHINHVFFISNK